MKLQDGETKWLLRKILYKYVPKELIEGPKMGFSVPLAAWLRGELKEWGSDLISSFSNSDNALLNQNHLEEAWREHQQKENDHSAKLWAALSYIAWRAKR